MEHERSFLSCGGVCSGTSWNEHEIFDLKLVVDTWSTRDPDTANLSDNDVRIIFTASAARTVDADDWRIRLCDQGLVIEESAAEEWIRVSYQDGATFVLKKDGSEIRTTWIAPLTPQDVEAYLYGPIAGLLLYLRGVTCLHASAIVCGETALAFVGAAEAGKSTLAAAFARKGYRVLTDDILAVARESIGIVAKPGIPRIGLWPQSVEHLWGHPDALPRQTPAWDKRHFDLLGAGLFQESALPIGAVYVIADRAPNGEFRIEPLTELNAMLAMISNKYVTRYSKREQDRRDFVALSELATRVPVRRVVRKDSLSDLGSTCEAILADYASLELVSP